MVNMHAISHIFDYDRTLCITDYIVKQRHRVLLVHLLSHDGNVPQRRLNLINGSEVACNPERKFIRCNIRLPFNGVRLVLGVAREIQASNVEPFFIAAVEIQRYIFNDDAGANGRKPRCVLFERIRTHVIARGNGYFFAITAFPIEITTSIHIAFIISKTNPCAHDEPPALSATSEGIKLPRLPLLL